jgi:hypothetical protein
MWAVGGCSDVAHTAKFASSADAVVKTLLQL